MSIEKTMNERDLKLVTPGGLTPEQKEAFVMKHVDGRSYEEMAELTGVGIDALKMRVHRARDGLREMLGGVL